MRIVPFVLSVLPLVAPVSPVAAQEAAPRTANEILREFDRVAMPSFSDGSDPESVRRFRAAIRDGCRRKAELAAELQRAHPGHARLPAVLATRWAGMTNALGEADLVLAELGPLLQDEALRDDVRSEARRALARARVASEHCSNVERFRAVADLIRHDDGDGEFAAACLMDLVEQRVVDPEAQRRMWQLAVDTWPDAAHAGRAAARWLDVLELLEQPFAAQLPVALQPWFATSTAGEADFTIVQIWSGWAGIERERTEIASLQQLRRDLGERVRVVGLVVGDLEARRSAIQAAGIDWPQAELQLATPSPFGAPKVGFHLVLDRELRIAGVVGRAALLRERIAALDRAAH